MAHVFISHATADLAIATSVFEWLRADGHDPFLAHHADDGIPVGEDWKDRLHDELRRSDAVVCVLSRAYLASTWCTAEAAIADVLGALVLPVRAEPGVVHPFMERLQNTDFAADPEEAKTRLLKVVRGLDTDGAGKWKDGDNPFPGLAPFSAALSRLFFGRSREIRQLTSDLRTSAGITAVIGPSGCGKSSLVRAGVVPRLDEDPSWLTLPVWRPGDDPVWELARVLTRAGRSSGLDWSVTGVRERLDADGLAVLADELLVAEGPDDRRLLVTVDQAEELFTRSDDQTRQLLAQLLRHAVRKRVRVLMTLRSEYVDDLCELVDAPIAAFPLGPLSTDMIRLAIERPARIAGIRVAPELTTRMVADTGRGDALPLLAFTLHHLADGLGRGDSLSEELYDRSGGVHGALAQQASACLERAVASTGLTEQEVLAGLVRLGARSLDTSLLPTDLLAALMCFVDQRLLVTHTVEGKTVISVAHEALLTAWKPLEDAINERADSLRAGRAVEAAAAEWAGAGRAAHFLWNDKRLLPVREALGSLEDDLTPDAQEFLVAARVHNDAEQSAARRRSRRRMRVLVTMLVIALVGAGVAVGQWVRADGQRDTATARRLVTEAENARAADPALALRLGVAANAVHASPETRANLVSSLMSNSYLGRIPGLSGGVGAVDFTEDGRRLRIFSGSDDPTIMGHVTTWEAGTWGFGEKISDHVLDQKGDGLFRAGVLRDSLVVAAYDHNVLLWDVPQSGEPSSARELKIGRAYVRAAGLRGDDRVLAVAVHDRVSMWELADGPREIGSFVSTSDEPVRELSFSPDGGLLAVIDEKSGVALWDVRQPAQPSLLTPPGRLSTGDAGVRFSPNGLLVATTAASGGAQLWDLTTPSSPRAIGEPLREHIDPVSAFAFSQDGRTFATGGQDNAIVLWNITDPARPARIGVRLTGHEGEVTSINFAPDGRTLVTGSQDRSAILWNIDEPETRWPQHRTDPQGWGLEGGTFSQDGKLLAVEEASKVFLWSTANRDAPVLLGSFGEGVTHVMGFSADGTVLVTFDSIHRYAVRWDVRDPVHPREVSRTDLGDVDRYALTSEDGRYLWTAGRNGEVLLWDVEHLDRPWLLTEVRDNGSPKVAVSRDGRIVAVAAGVGRVRLWDLVGPSHAEPLGEVRVGNGTVSTMAFSPDGRTLVVAAGDTAGATLWDVSDPGRPVRMGSPLAGHEDYVNRIAFRPDGDIMVTKGRDGAVILWDMTDPQRPQRIGPALTGLPRHDNMLAAFSPDGRTLALGNTSNEIMFVDVGRVDDLRAQAMQVACERAGRGLTETEWERYVGLAFVRTC